MTPWKLFCLQINKLNYFNILNLNEIKYDYNEFVISISYENQPIYWTLFEELLYADDSEWNRNFIENNLISQ